MSKLRDYRIVISEKANTNELRAAAFIRDNVRLVTGITLETVRDTEPPRPLEIVVGETNREALDGIDFERQNHIMWEYTLQNKGDRFYLTGLGERKPYPEEYSAAKLYEDGSSGCSIAAYKFVEKVLGYDFMNSAYESFPENEELEIPEDFEYSLKRDVLRAQEPEDIKGAAMFAFNVSELLTGNTHGYIFRTREGKIIVYDGGRVHESDRFMRGLKKIAGTDTPHVTAWIFSHLHGDHFGMYNRLCIDEEFRSCITVDDFYCDLATEEFYTTLSTERKATWVEIRNNLLNSESTVGARVHTVKVGDIIKVDEIEIEVIHVPTREDFSRMNMNDSSVVYKLTYDGGQTIMLLGDAERSCNEDLVNNRADKLKSDIVQVGHHGCGNVSRRCYELIDAKAYIWPIVDRFWYSDNGTELNTHNTGVIKTRDFMMQLKPKKENVYLFTDGILSVPLPMPIH
ncbi:MAG: hypothetical protein E7641_00155 [Ruminococcaceae bacterium]|nr:hypothetical protein [Oscillospiraceae bacterium]